MKVYKRLFSYILILAILVTTVVSTNIYASAAQNEVAYITTRTSIKNIHSANVKGSNSSINFTIIDPQNVGQITQNIICVDSEYSQNDKIKKLLKECYNNGCTIILRKDNIKIDEVYNYFDEKLPKLDSSSNSENKDIQDNGSDGRLHDVAMSIKKDNKGINTTLLRAEDTSDEAICSDIAYIAANTTVSTISAATSTPSWIPVVTQSWIDFWTYLTVRASITLQKNPYNPNSNGQYYYLTYSPIDIQPNTNSLNGYRDVYFRLNGVNGIVYNYGPTVSGSSTNFSFTLGLPPAFTISGNFGPSMVTNLYEGGIGQRSTKWLFYPTLLGIKCFSFTNGHFELVNEYYQTSNSFQGILSYSIELKHTNGITNTMYTYSAIGPTVSGC